MSLSPEELELIDAVLSQEPKPYCTDSAIWLAAKDWAYEQAAQKVMESFGWGEGMGGLSRYGDDILEQCAKSIRALARPKE